MSTSSGPSFHNTIQVEPQLLIQFEATAAAQEYMVLEVMNKLKRAAYFQVQAHLPDMNEDSLKRSLTNLKTRGLLTKDTDKGNMVMGPHGKRCHQYILTPKTHTQC